MNLKSLLPLVIVAAVAGGAAPTTAPSPVTRPAATRPAERASLTRFLRFVDDGAKGARLEASEITYRNAQGVQVRLVSAVHIGERSYFQAISRGFQADDAVLYEMVKPKGTPAPKLGAVSNHPVGRFQRFLKDSLNLEFQLDHIDYTKPNFIHADLDAETFAAMQDERNESFSSLMIQSMIDAMSRPMPESAGGDPTAQLLTLLAQPDPERQVKLMLARQFNDIDAAARGLDGPKGSVILTERNKAAISVLKETLKQGKKQISIFYGAAHMPDMERRVRELGFTEAGTRWTMAWDVSIRPGQLSAFERWFGPTTGPATRPVGNGTGK